MHLLQLADATAGWQGDAAQCRAALGAAMPEWLVADHYALDARWERAMRAPGMRIAVVDDLADRAHDCDLLVDASGGGERYRGLVPESARALCGPQFALLRPEFAAARAHAAPRTRVARILVAFGGADAGGDTEKALRALRGAAGLHVEVVAGALNPRRAGIAALCAELPSAQFVGETDDMARLMAQADLAIGAAGGTTWERCCLYLPAVILLAAANQVTLAQAAARQGAALDLGWPAAGTEERLAHAVEALRREPARLAEMSRRAGALVDGLGARRVAEAMEAACA